MNNSIFRGLTFLLFSALGLFGEEVFVQDRGYYLDIPETWVVMDATDQSAVSFTDSGRKAVLQILAFQGTSFPDSASMLDHVKTQLKAEGEGAAFTYNGLDSRIADLSFSSGSSQARGYFICINGDAADYLLMGFAPLSDYDAYITIILSALDSFSDTKDARFSPGPVSQFYYPFPGTAKEKISLSINGKPVTITLDKGEGEASQVLVEREASILMKYPKGSIKAWNRFYRMIYRDNYHRLDSVYDLFKPGLKGKGDLKAAETVLAWIQDFKYVRTQGVSDILSPLAALLSQSGDCDSRALLYVILLRHFGIDAVLLTSLQYGHAGAGVYLPSLPKGAKVAFEGKDYYYAELTDKVKLGLIDQSMADPAGWIPMRLDMSEGE